MYQKLKSKSMTQNPKTPNEINLNIKFKLKMITAKTKPKKGDAPSEPVAIKGPS
jgi:hypothetical protein